jgi:hypothetical protein
VPRAAATELAEAPAIQGPVLNKKYHGPHAVPEEGITRIVDMLRKGDMFRYGGNDEGSLQVREALAGDVPCGVSASQPLEQVHACTSDVSKWHVAT